MTYPVHHGFMMLPFTIFSIILMIILVLVIIKLVKKYGKGQHFIFKEITETKPLEILNERFAKGEISEEEYLNKKEHILKK
jgi:putative membrane protein